jgi:WS/DGAT C-terminal domain
MSIGGAMVFAPLPFEWISDFYSHRLDRTRPSAEWMSGSYCSTRRRLPAGGGRSSARFTTAWSIFNQGHLPGPRDTLYSFGAPMLELLPLVPLFARHSLGIAIFSYDHAIVIGLNADRDTTPDLEVLAKGIERSFGELKELTRA